MSARALIFLSTYNSKLDDKNRVSMPVAFRNVAQKASEEAAVYAYPSFVNECIEFCTTKHILYLEKYVDSMDTFSAERDIISTTILAGCEPLAIDAKGRIFISERLAQFANLQKEVLFVGKGKTFEIWQPTKFQEHYEHARNMARQNRFILKSSL